ncbi:hypothetical protein AB751O23_AA_00240 [Chlamydiales bacterium SCGC AB-751-O23]|jgi:serine/threonine protein phosphatase PrpC|nr:hypothetical protein AB751O23_AA_00240 [Chlamydiales bacterium SCGC AB-751-O23]
MAIITSFLSNPNFQKTFQYPKRLFSCKNLRILALSQSAFHMLFLFQNGYRNQKVISIGSEGERRKLTIKNRNIKQALMLSSSCFLLNSLSMKFFKDEDRGIPLWGKLTSGFLLAQSLALYFKKGKSPLERVFAPFSPWEEEVNLEDHYSFCEKAIYELKAKDLEESRVKRLIDEMLPKLFDFSSFLCAIFDPIDRKSFETTLSRLTFIRKEEAFNTLKMMHLLNKIFLEDKAKAGMISLHLLSKLQGKESSVSYSCNRLLFFLLQSLQDIASSNYQKKIENGCFPKLKTFREFYEENKLSDYFSGKLLRVYGQMYSQSFKLLRDFRTEESLEGASRRIIKKSREAVAITYSTLYPLNYRSHRWKSDVVDKLIFEKCFGSKNPSLEQLELESEDLGVAKVAYIQGERDSMEDSHFVYQGSLGLLEGRKMPFTLYGILDGHGGSKISNQKDLLRACIVEELEKFSLENDGEVSYLTVYNAVKIAFPKFQNIILRDFLKGILKDSNSVMGLSQSIFRGSKVGTTVLIVLEINGECYFINSGDSRAVLVDPSSGMSLSLTKDHKPKEEEKGIRNRGGCVIDKFGTFRISGDLAPGRASGDIGIMGINFRPTITCLSEILKIYQGIPLEKAIIVLACDGLWDVITPEEVADNFSKEDYERELVTAAINRTTRDNVTVMLIKDFHKKLKGNNSIG